MASDIPADDPTAVDEKPRPRRRLKNLKLDRVDLVTAGANPGAFVMLHKSDELTDAILEVAMADEMTEAPEAPKPEKEMDPVETVAKADFEVLQKSLAEEAEVRKALEERLAKMEYERKESEFVAKAKDMSNLGGASEVGHLLLDINQNVPAETFQSLERLLKAANAQLEKGDLFASLGRSDAESPTNEDRILELAKEKLQAGTAKTIELAKLAVMHENPDLRAEYLNSKRSQ